MSADPEAPYGRDADGNPLPAPAGTTQEDASAQLAAANAKIAELEQQLAIATTSAKAPATATATATIGAPVPSAVVAAPEPDGQAVAVHAIAPGSAGPVVAELAAKVEQAGQKTYLTDPAAQNPTHVFTDDLLDAVRRILHEHPQIAAVVDESERQRLNRWIANLHVVTGEVWQLIQDVVDAKTAA